MSSLIGKTIKLGFKIQTNEALFRLYLIWNNFISCVDLLEGNKCCATPMQKHKSMHIPFQSMAPYWRTECPVSFLWLLLPIFAETLLLFFPEEQGTMDTIQKCKGWGIVGSEIENINLLLFLGTCFKIVCYLHRM